MNAWSVDDAKQLYSLPFWSEGYFDVDAAGRVCAQPLGPEGPRLPIPELIEQATRDGLNLLVFLIVVAVLPMILAFAMHQQRVTAATLKHRANIDPLTGLANRNAFEEMVQAALANPSAHIVGPWPPA